MILFKSEDQFILFPAIGFVRDGDIIALNISWLNLGLNIILFHVNDERQ